FLVPAFENRTARAVAFWIDRHWFLAGHVMHAIFGPDRSRSPGTPPGSPGSSVLGREMQPMLRELEALHADAERWGIPLVALLVTPADAEPGYSPLQYGYNQTIAAFAADHGICCVDPLPTFVAAEARGSMRLGGDPHWSPLAHDLAAARILDVLRQSLDSAS